MPHSFFNSRLFSPSPSSEIYNCTDVQMSRINIGKTGEGFNM
jgi:hypothetical protein